MEENKKMGAKDVEEDEIMSKVPRCPVCGDKIKIYEMEEGGCFDGYNPGCIKCDYMLEVFSLTRSEAKSEWIKHNLNGIQLAIYKSMIR